MGLLHPERWQELAPEFEARALLQQAEKTLIDAPDHATVARTLKAIRDAYRLQHPSVQDPAACDEYEQRKAGTYAPNGGERKLSPSTAKQLSELQQQNRDLLARLEKLEKPSKQDPAKDAK